MTDAKTWAALGRGLSEHPDDALMLLRAVRDDEGQVVDLSYEWVNATAERNAGEALQGRTVLDVYSEHDAFQLSQMKALLLSGGSARMQVTFPADGDDQRLRGHVYWLFMAAVDGDLIVCQYRDVTALRDSQRQLEHHAGHDELTGLPNRRLLWEHLDLALARLDRGGRELVVLMCDLDGFKAVNDTHGHAVGDELLRQVGPRLRSAVRPQDLLARYGGDEFVILCEDMRDGDAAALTRRVRDAFTDTFQVGGRTVRIGISIGAAVTSTRVAGDQLLLEADRALYADKLARHVPGP
jgi:diguanylate cyclase (GGDEF)-like protein